MYVFFYICLFIFYEKRLIIKDDIRLSCLNSTPIPITSYIFERLRDIIRSWLITVNSRVGILSNYMPLLLFAMNCNSPQICPHINDDRHHSIADNTRNTMVSSTEVFDRCIASLPSNLHPLN